MRKILIALFCILFTAFNSFSQCVPDTSVTNNVPGVYPDTIQNLPHSIVGSMYSTVMQIKVKTDTNVTYMGFPVHACIDSIVINSVTGLPSGYTFSCNPASCSFPGGGDGCIDIQGPAPTAGEVGMVYPLDVNVTIYAVICGGSIHQSVSDVITGYSITVDNSTGMPDYTNVTFNAWQNIPNPFHGASEISYLSPKNDLVTFRVSNLLGNVVYTKTYLAQRGMNKIILSSKDFDAGIYMYTLSNSRNSVTKRMIVSNE